MKTKIEDNEINNTEDVDAIIKPPRQTTEEIIPKRLCAIEVYNHVFGQYALAFWLIGTNFVTALLAGFSLYAGAVVAGIFTIGCGFMMRKYKQKMFDLENRYNIKPKTIFPNKEKK